MTLQSPLPSQPDKLDQLLADHLQTVLEPQRGRAAAAFRRHLADPSAASAPKPIPIARGLIPRRALWYWAGVPSLVAACLAVVVTLHVVKPAGVTGDRNPTAIAGNGVQFDAYQQSRNVDGGITMLDDHTPVRVIRQQTMTHKQWEDPIDHATYSVDEPVEKVGYIQVQPY